MMSEEHKIPSTAPIWTEKDATLWFRPMKKEMISTSTGCGLKIFHAIVTHPHCPEGERMDFVWVRWFGRQPAYRVGWKQERLDRIGFLNDRDEQFGFLNPSDVIRACHLIPAFSHGRTEQFLGTSKYRHKGGDWMYYYVNRYVSPQSQTTNQVRVIVL
jgi:hypothetical protein